MARNRCELTFEGRKALNQLLELVYPKGHSETALSEDTGLTRDTLDKIFEMLYSNPQKPVRAVQYIKLEQLFDRLNIKLVDQDKAQYAFQPRYCREVSRATHTRFATVKQPIALPVASTFSPQKRLDTLLRCLDYEAGQASFIRVIKQSNPARAFLVHVHDTRVHRWLIKRLEREVPFNENAKRAEVNVARLGGNFELLWRDLAEQLTLPNGTIEGRIASLSELCQEKTVIIALSRFQQLDEEMQRQLIEEFWFPLVKRICSENQQRQRSRLVLFLIEDEAISQENHKYPFEVALSDAANNPEYPVRLEPLKQISADDVQYWFDLHSSDFLTELLGKEEADKRTRREKISQWDQAPWTTLENICNLFQIDIAEIEHNWKLAG